MLCRTEGACGLAYSGYSPFFVDATDPEHRIYEFGPGGGAVWHSLPAPGSRVDGLAYDQGELLALSFDENRIYRIDPFDGTVLGHVALDVDIIGGLAAGGGIYYASRIRPPVVFAIDAETGALPTGLTQVGSRLYVGDFSGERILEFDIGSGGLLGELAGISGRFSALASGVAVDSVPYVLQLAPVAEHLAADGRVELVLRAGVYRPDGQLLHANDHAQINFSVLGGEDQTVQVTAGEAEAAFRLDPGSVVEVEARVAGLAPVALVRRIIAPTTQMIMHFTEIEQHILEIEVELFDATGALAVEDTSAVSFSVLRGLGAVVGPEVVGAREGRARTWVRVEGRDTDMVVAAQVRSILHSGGFQVSSFDPASAAATGGLAVTATRVAGRDDFPPAPPTAVQVRRQDDQLEIRWGCRMTMASNYGLNTATSWCGAAVWRAIGSIAVRMGHSTRKSAVLDRESIASSIIPTATRRSIATKYWPKIGTTGARR